MPHPGNVSTQAMTMSFTMRQSTLESRFAAPAPMIAVVLVCVVETGIPKIELMRSVIAAERSAEKP